MADRRIEPEGDGVAQGSATLSTGWQEPIAVGDTLRVLDETFDVSKKRTKRSTVRVATRTERYVEVATVELSRNTVDVTRVPVGRIVEEPPQVRVEGEVTIVPVVEERYVVVKQLFLIEELHIRNDASTVIRQVPIELRRQVAVVERISGEGRAGPAAPEALEKDGPK